MLFSHSILLAFLALLVSIRFMIYAYLLMDMCAQPLLNVNRALTAQNNVALDSNAPEHPEDKIHITIF